MSGAGGMGMSASFNTSFSDINTGLFGVDQTSTQSGSGTKKATEKVTIDQIGIMKMIDDALKGTSGIAEIFGLQAGAGLFDSSGSSDATGDLLAKIAGELAKVTGVRELDEETTSVQTQEQKSSGILDSAFGGISSKLGGIF